MFDESKLSYIEPDDIPHVELLPKLKELEDTLARVCKHFFSIGLESDPSMAKNAPIRGFILYGEPGTGKTELVKQVFRRVHERMGGGIKFAIIDGSDIAAARWGDAEKKMKKLFAMADTPDQRKILLFDDIDCFIMGRSTHLAQEWHFSMNAIFFHQLDRLNPSNLFVFATTNRKDLVDKALFSRLYPIEIKDLGVEQLMQVVNQMLDATKVQKGERRDLVTEDIRKELEKLKEPTIRDARQHTIFQCINRGLWSQ